MSDDTVLTPKARAFIERETGKTITDARELSSAELAYFINLCEIYDRQYVAP